jgi:dihydropteroate synthase
VSRHRPGTRTEDLAGADLAREMLAGLGFPPGKEPLAELPLPCRALRVAVRAPAEGRELADAAETAGAAWIEGSRASLVCGTARALDETVAHLARAGETGARLASGLARSLAGYRRRERALTFADGETWDLGARTRVMGILNVTPDSFFDGGRWDEAGAAVEQGLRLADEGADVVDVGGESSRPGADPVGGEEERRRVLPVIEGLRRARPSLRLSVDTVRASTARAALEAGADLVNDISGLRADPGMASVAAELGAPLVLMHMRGRPRDMQRDTGYADLLSEIVDFLAESCEIAGKAGVAGARIVLDPGIGFGKSAEGNEQILRHLSTIRSLGHPLLVGASRKSFLGRRLGGVPPEERLEGSLAAAAAAIHGGAQMVRVHDVRATARLARVSDALARGR